MTIWVCPHTSRDFDCLSFDLDIGVNAKFSGYIFYASRKSEFYCYLISLKQFSVITGSTDGIGKAYAQELASMGVNIILISRSAEKLRKVAKELGGYILVQYDIVQKQRCCYSRT